MHFSLLTLSGVAIFTGIAAAHPFESISQPRRLDKRIVSPDETCGLVNAGNNKGYSCGPTNVGPCCSQYGWCGSSTAHCGTGCQSTYGTCGVVSSSSGVVPTSTSTGTATPTSTGVTDPNLCGPANKNMICSTGCCSQYGYCGTTTDYCDGGCQPLYGTCNVTPGDDGTCGPANSGKKCATGRCCSAQGYCGTGSDYCQSPDCLVGYGTCDADMVPPGSSTVGIARPLLGSVPYAVDIYDCVQPGTVAITYDDGPFTYTAHLLDVLKSYGARATFFMTGVNLSKGRIDDPTLPWPALVTRAAAEGHQIAAHTWSHADLSTLTDAARTTEMVKLEMAFRNILGYFPTYMRPPYSSCNAACMATMKTLGYHISYFDLDTEDYLHDAPDQIQISKDIVKKAIQGSSPTDSSWLAIGHDIHYQTVYNLTALFLDTLTAKGFKAVTLGECLNDPKANWYRTATASPVSSTTTSTSSSTKPVSTSSTKPVTSSSSTKPVTSSSSTKPVSTSSSTKPVSTSSSTKPVTSSSSTKTSTTSTKTSTTTSASPTSTCTTYKLVNWCAQPIKSFSNRSTCLTAYNSCTNDATVNCPAKAGSTNSGCGTYNTKVCKSLSGFCNTCTAGKICTNAKWGGPIYP